MCNGYIGCKDCRVLAEADPLRCLPLAIEEVIQLGKAAKQAQKHSATLEAVVDVWMEKVSAGERKKISHCGAVRTSKAQHPTHFRCQVLGNTFDPGNVVYELTWKLIVPKFRAAVWNEETFGDIAEGILAVGYNLAQLSEPFHFAMDMTATAQIIEEVARLVYDVVCFFPTMTSVASIKTLGQLAQSWGKRDTQLPQEVTSPIDAVPEDKADVEEDWAIWGIPNTGTPGAEIADDNKDGCFKCGGLGRWERIEKFKFCCCLEDCGAIIQLYDWCIRCSKCQSIFCERCSCHRLTPHTVGAS